MKKLNKLAILIATFSLLCGQTIFVFATADPEAKQAKKRQNKILENRDKELQSPILFDLSKNEMFIGKPTIERVPVDIEFVDDGCGFDINTHFTGTAVYIYYTDTLGVYHEFMAFAQGRAELTDLVNGNSLIFNISGPGKTTVDPDGSIRLIGTGPWIWFADPDTLASGYYLTKGRFVLSIDAEGNRTFSRTGNKFDICAML